MKTFPQQPSVFMAPIGDQRSWRPTLWILDEDYRITQYLNRKELIIESGFPFSASIPWPFWILIKPTGTLFIPGLVHDNLYKYNPFNWTRKQCDYCFWEIAERMKHRKYRHSAAYYSVRVGGLNAWNEHRRYQRKENK